MLFRPSCPIVATWNGRLAGRSGTCNRSPAQLQNWPRTERRGLATGNVVAFADAAPSPSLVAHEVAHAVQNEHAGAMVPMASGVVAPGDSAAEAEAEAAAGIVAAHGPGTPLPTVSAKPAAHIHLSPDAAGVPTPRLDKAQDAMRLRALIASRSQPQIVELLEQNASPQHMYALHRAYGSTLVADVQRALTEKAYFARARVYLGEQMSLDAKIQSRTEGDSEAIFGDLERLPDARALSLVTGDAVAIPVAASKWIPATSTLAAVKDALRARLPAESYARAMRLLLDKAERAIAAQAAQAPAGQSLDSFTVHIDDLRVEQGPASPISLSPVSHARVDMAEERIRAADEAGNWMADPLRGRAAALALAELNGTERQALSLRLSDRPLRNAVGSVALAGDALERDDATVIRKAILDVQMIASVQARASRGVGLELAMERAGDLVRAARARLASLPPSAPHAQRDKAQAEVQRLESMFFGAGSPVLDKVRLLAQRAGDSDGGVAAVGSQLRALGADTVTVAAEQLRAVPAGDGAALISTLRKIAAGDRLTALQRAGLLDALSRGSLQLQAEQREQMSALVWQGAPPIEAGDDASAGSEAPIVVPPVLSPPLLGPRPEVVLALHDVLDAIDRRAAHEVLGRLARMSDADQRAVYSDPRFRQKFAALPEGDERSASGHFKESLRTAQRSGARTALLGYPTYIDSEHKVHVESLGAQMDDAGPGGQANLRRAYVLIERLGGPQRLRTNPALLVSLPPADREAVQKLVLGRDGGGGLLGKRDRLDRDDDKETASQLIFGQPDLGGGLGSRDPGTEAEFMYYRLREAARIRDGVAISDWLSTAGPSADESVTEFMVLYQRSHGADMSTGDLAQLADLYHRALRRLDSYRATADSLAGSAAQIVGATVATIVVTVFSGGTLGPIAVGAMATMSAAASSAAAGAAVRARSTLSSVLKDAGTGAIEGLTAAVGTSLTARIVRGASVGLPAGRAAASIGARAVGQTGHAGAEIAAAIIDGALGSASGELFQTATDEATWDRGIAEAFAAMLAAVARSAAVGAVMGGAIGTAAQAASKLGRAIGRAGEHEASGALARDHAPIELARDHAPIELARDHAPVEPPRAHDDGAHAPSGASLVDARPRVTPERIPELSERLHLPVEIDSTLHDGIELHYVLESNRDIRPTVVRIGPQALVTDILAHGNVAVRITRYNGAIGKLRKLWDRLVALVKRTGQPLREGTNAWKSYHELAKLDELIAKRQATRMAEGAVDPLVLDQEIEFLEGYRAHHETIVAEAEASGHIPVDPSGHIDSPAHQPPGPAPAGSSHASSAPSGQQSAAPAPVTSRVSEPVQGLYAGVKPEPKIADWTVKDTITVEKDGTKVALTQVTTPDGKSGYVERAYNPKTKQFEMRNAFLEAIPGWVDEGGPGLGARGIPTVHYLTLRQTGTSAAGETA